VDCPVCGGERRGELCRVNWSIAAGGTATDHPHGLVRSGSSKGTMSGVTLASWTAFKYFGSPKLGGFRHLSLFRIVRKIIL
jgi:hypothetical protein